MLHLVIFSIFVLSWVTQAGFYILIWWPCKQYWNSSFRFVYQYWLNIWALHFSLESAVSILLEVRLSSLVFSTYMEEEGASAIMRWGRHLGVKCAERERVCVWHASLCSYVFECTVYRSGQELGVSSVQGAPAPVQHSIRHRQTCLDQSYFSPASSFNSVPWETLCHFVCILNWNQSRHDNINSILSCSRRH